MKSLIICILITVLALSFLVGLNGCTTGTFRLKITPMKVEINAPDTQEAPPAPAPKQPILK